MKGSKEERMKLKKENRNTKNAQQGGKGSKPIQSDLLSTPSCPSHSSNSMLHTNNYNYVTDNREKQKTTYEHIDFMDNEFLNYLATPPPTTTLLLLAASCANCFFDFFSATASFSLTISSFFSSATKAMCAGQLM